MNALLLQDPVKHRLTLAEFRAAWRAGAFPDYPKLELIEGDLYLMPDDGARTIEWNARILSWMFPVCGLSHWIVADKTLDCEPYGGPKPDFYVFARTMPFEDVHARDALLVIEISDTTLRWDAGVKAALYAKAGVRDYWCVDVEARRILVHRNAENGAYPAPQIIEAGDRIEALLIPGLALRLSDLT